jgi:hypothetical protein
MPILPEVTGQVAGYWFGPGESVPAHPVGRPTGAVLPERRSTFSEAVITCLDLVPVQNYWLVLSELGRYTYRHTSGLLLDEKWIFVPVPEAAGKWPRKYDVSYGPALPPVQIAAAYGIEAAQRARPDANAVQLRLRLKRTTRV